jgi:hypothetical protein
MTIAILEDDADRIGELTACLRDRFPKLDIAIFDNAPDMIVWLSENLSEVLLICLDHDLGPNCVRDGRVFDPGTGRDVANYLAALRPVCPVIIHSTNTLAVPGMQLVLEDAGWLHARISPYNDLEWVRDSWIDIVTEVLSLEQRSC